MSSTTAPVVGRVGVWAAPGTASTPPQAISRGSPSNAELEAFQRVVRPVWWRSLWPFYTTAAFAAAVILVASEAPAPVTVRRMLTPAGPAISSVERSAAAQAPARDEYQLPAHWRAAAAPPPRPCDPLSGIGC